ncbi:MFS transporter [Pusillimonas caeni]|uniref:MFS transporter n=1 Tax=Pusillimonas caeni TaxID=1348472 RepID=UPI000E5A06F3|nr:MFS transporter [Pusillimonas caeni]TFL15647.1 MFS transporter [Pusillimonas caeni]
MSRTAYNAPRISRQGWLIVLVCLLGISTGPAAMGLASMGLFARALGESFQWDRSQLSLAVSAMMLCTAASLPLVGHLIDRYGVRRVLIPSVILLALCMVMLGMMQSYWQFVAAYVVMGTLAAGTNSVPYMRLLSSWFDRQRGLAIGIAGSGTGLGFAYIPLITERTISAYGWRGGYFSLALLLMVVTLPMVAFLLREPPTGAAHDGDGPPPGSVGDNLAEALRKRDFWLLGIIFVALAGLLYGLIPHLVPLLTDRGITDSQAAWIASIFGFSAFGGRLLIGMLIDHFDARRIAFIFFLFSAIGLGIFMLPSNPMWAVVVAAIMLGGSLGAEVDMLAYFTSRYFGLRHFAKIFGVLFGAVLVAMGLGPLLFGMVFDATGSYQSILMLSVPICLISIVLLFGLRPYGERARGGPVSIT